MKKILISALLMAGVAFGADAVTYAYDVASNYTGTYALSTPANFKTGNTSISSNYNKSGKWYVNAGHGGFESDDRPTPMPLLGGEYFYESEGNLDRAFHMQKFLEKNGGTVKMSRTTNTSSSDLNLTSIATYSSSYGGYFISMHSNGANASANYHVALYKGSNSTNSIGGSERMAYWNSYNNYKNGCLSNYTYGTPRSMADYDLMGWHYGVLRTNTQPGYLVETWFHDYRPESLRFKSSLYNKFLAWQIAVGNLTAPGGSGSLPACLVGDVRDVTKGCGYSNYTARGRDSYLALNNVTVTLSGNGLNQSVTTGAKCNGVYAFFVPAGTYTLTFKKSGYKDVTKTVTATVNKATQNNIDMVEGVNSGISLNPTSTGFGETPVGNTSAKTITVTGTSLTSNITISNSDNTNFSISKTSLGTTGGTFEVVYKPSKAGSHSTTISFVSGTHKASMVVTGTAKNPPLSFTEGWNYSEKSGKKAGWMANWTNYRNMAFGDGKLYVVDATNGVVKVIKAQTAEHIKDLNMTGVSGGALKLVDVAYVDGKLIGTNIALSTNDAMKTLKVYIWDNDDAAPRVLLETTDLGGMTRIGDAIEVQGNLTSGKLVYLAQQTRDYTDADGNAKNGNCNSLVTYALSNGTASKTPVVSDIDAFIIGMSPRAIPDGNNFWVAGQQHFPSQITAGGELVAAVPNTAFNVEAAFHGCGNDFVPFTFKGNKYAFAVDYQAVTKAGSAATADEIKTTTLLGGRAVLIDGSAGWAVEGLKNSGNYPSAGMSSTTRNTTLSSSICVNVNGDAGVEMWVLIHNQGIAYYKHGTAPTYTYEKVPEISVPAGLDITTVEGISKSETITVGAQLLTGDISVALAGSSTFSIDKTTLGKDGGSIKVTYNPTAAGSHAATLTLSAAGAATKTVQLKGTATAKIAQGLTKVWQNTSSVPGSAAGGDVRFAAVSNGKLLVNDKANNKILEVTSTGSAAYYDPSAAITANYNQVLGTGIACDDAGNILVNSGFSAASSGSNFTLISADLKSTYKIDLSAIEGWTPGRCDQLGRIRGNMLSSEGGYAFITPNGGTAILVVKIKNGAVDTDYTQVTNPIAGVGLTTSCCPQPAFETVAEIDALMDDNNDLSNAFIMRSRSVPGSVFAWNDDNSDMVKAWTFSEKSSAGHTVANASVEGFDWFKLYDKSYFIMPMTSDGTTGTRGSIFGIYDGEGALVACWSDGEKTGLGAAMGSFIAVPNNDYSVNIYHFVPGTVAEKFTFAVSPKTGVENIETEIVDENVDAPARYFNLQGVEVANPSNGIYIKVQGNRSSKVYIK
ncbi:MAG: N-acetylmuramoyl-L-alanine amidase [Muribaculaceae bacterium]|nr:N-acetylmuramoyl-L-alanine amidase [Muribaculaceae bacterium]